MIAILLAAMLAAPPADHDAATNAALAFYRAYAGGDAVDGVPARQKRFLRTHCLALGRLEATKVAIDGDTATVDVQAEWLDWTMMPGAVPIVDFGDGKVMLRRNSGLWRVADWKPAAAAFADALAAGDQTVLENPRIRCRAAVREIARRAVTLVNQKKFETAGALVAAAERIAEEIGDDAALALAAASESVVRRYWRVDGEASAVLARRSVRLAEQAGDADALIRAHLAYGRTVGIDADTDALRKIFALRDFVADPALTALLTSRLAAVSDDTGDHWSALQYANTAARYAEESGDMAAMISAELNIAGVYDIYEDHELAAVHHRRAAELSLRAGFRMIAANAQVNEANDEAELGHHARVRKLIDSAVAMEPALEAWTLVLRARLERDPIAADRYASQAEDLARRNGDVFVLTETFRALTRFRLDAGRPAAALPMARALEEWLDGTTALRFKNAALAAETYRRLGMTKDALRVLRTAIELSECERINMLGSNRQQQSFSATRLHVYGELVTILIDQGKTVEALSAADETKGRTLLDMLKSNRTTFREVMTPAERQRELALHDGAAALRRTMAEASGESRQRLADELARSRLDIDAFDAAMAVKYPKAIPAWSSPAPVTEATLRELLGDRSTAVVEFMVTEDRLHAFTITRAARGGIELRARSTPIRGATLRRRVERFVAALSRADVGYRAEARKLYDLLLAPLAPQLASARVVCIIPDGPLWQLPFEALLARDGHFFVERAATFYSPSIAVYARMQNRESKQDGTLFALANPAVAVPADAAVSRLRAGEMTPLPDAEREVHAAARILGGRSAVYVGADASKEKIEREAAGFRILHFATHGVLDDTDPMYSHLLLAPARDGDDGVLETWQMMRMRFDAELAVLSACDTARGRYREGEGVVGMTWAFFVAGCPSTIATQWKIASAPTADLLIDFYRQWSTLRQAPFAKAKALAAAQRRMLRQPRRRHPFYWAPFILVGAG